VINGMLTMGVIRHLIRISEDSPIWKMGVSTV
jgi:hypothetical protein